MLLDVKEKAFLPDLHTFPDRISAVTWVQPPPRDVVKVANVDVIVPGCTQPYHILVVAMVNGRVEAWDVASRVLLQAHSHHSDEVSCAASSPLRPGLIVTGDRRGKVVVWDLTRRTAVHHKPFSSPVCCVALSPYDGNEVALGYQSGLLATMDLLSGKQMIQLDGHEDEVQMIAYNDPVDIPAAVGGETDEEEVKTGDKHSSCRSPSRRHLPLLASASRDKTVTVWNLETGVRHRTITVQKSKGRSKEKTRTRVWISLCWLEHNSLVVSSLDGTLASFDLGPQRPIRTEWKGGHTRVVFSLHRCSRSHSLLSTSMDRSIREWDIATQKSTWELASLGGFVNDMSVSRHGAPHVVAMALGDKTMRFWNTAKPKNKYSCATLWRGFQSKVTSVACHPTREDLVAYGMEGGLVGLYSQRTQKHTRLRSCHRGTVYRVQWRPQVDVNGEGGNTTRTENGYALFSIGGGTVLCLPSADSQELPSPDSSSKISELLTVCGYLDAADAAGGRGATGPQPSPKERGKKGRSSLYRTELCWNAQGDLLAVGWSNGAVHVYRAGTESSPLASLSLIRVFHDQTKTVNRLEWQHQVASESAPQDTHLLAVGSHDSVICIYSIPPTHISKDDTDVGFASVFVPGKQAVLTLKGHKGPVPCLDWSPLLPNMLASCSYDGTVQVWDTLEGGRPVANLRGHTNRVMSVLWSHMNPHTLYSASEDQTVRVWDIDPQKDAPEHTLPPAVSIVEPPSRASRKKSSKSGSSSTIRAVTLLENGSPNSSGTVSNAVDVHNNGHSGDANYIPTTSTHPTTFVSTAAINASLPAPSSSPSSSSGSFSREDTKKEKLKPILLPFANEPRLSALKSCINLVTRASGHSDSCDTPKRIGLDNLFTAVQEGSMDSFLSETTDHLESQVAVLQQLETHLRRRLAVAGRDGSQESTALSLSEEQVDALCSISGNLSRSAVQAMSDVSLLTATSSAINSSYVQHQQSSHSQNTFVWRSRIGKALKNATSSGKLDATLVALSASCGYDVWQHTNAVYGEILAKRGDTHNAVLHFLAAGDIHKAVDAYVGVGFFGDAVAVASCNAVPSDPLVVDTILSWARACEVKGMYEQAAKCYFCVGRITEGIHSILRRTSPDIMILKAALTICREALRVQQPSKNNDCVDMNVGEIATFTDASSVTSLSILYTELVQSYVMLCIGSGLFEEASTFLHSIDSVADKFVLLSLLSAVESAKDHDIASLPIILETGDVDFSAISTSVEALTAKLNRSHPSNDPISYHVSCVYKSFESNRDGEEGEFPQVGSNGGSISSRKTSSVLFDVAAHQVMDLVDEKMDSSGKPLSTVSASVMFEPGTLRAGLLALRCQLLVGEATSSEPFRSEKVEVCLNALRPFESTTGSLPLLRSAALVLASLASGIDTSPPTSRYDYDGGDCSSIIDAATNKWLLPTSEAAKQDRPRQHLVVVTLCVLHRYLAATQGLFVNDSTEDKKVDARKVQLYISRSFRTPRDCVGLATALASAFEEHENDGKVMETKGASASSPVTVSIRISPNGNGVHLSIVPTSTASVAEDISLENRKARLIEKLGLSSSTLSSSNGVPATSGVDAPALCLTVSYTQSPTIPSLVEPAYVTQFLLSHSKDQPQPYRSAVVSSLGTYLHHCLSSSSSSSNQKLLDRSTFVSLFTQYCFSLDWNDSL